MTTRPGVILSGHCNRHGTRITPSHKAAVFLRNCRRVFTSFLHSFMFYSRALWSAINTCLAPFGAPSGLRFMIICSLSGWQSGWCPPGARCTCDIAWLMSLPAIVKVNNLHLHATKIEFGRYGKTLIIPAVPHDFVRAVWLVFMQQFLDPQTATPFKSQALLVCSPLGGKPYSHYCKKKDYNGQLAKGIESKTPHLQNSVKSVNSKCNRNKFFL